MINTQSVDSQKMIVFTDNRQDAAFQAGWMQDHARRYRLRHLIYEFLKEKNSTISITDIEHHLFEILSKDKNLGLMLAPEVYEFYSDETYSQEFTSQLRYFIRIQLIRELGTSFSQKEGLEPWGLLEIVYEGVNSENEWIKDWSDKMGINPEELTSSISSLLDVFRRNRYIYDNKAPIFSRAWREGDREIQLGYLPLIMGVGGNAIPPKGLIEFPEQTRTSYQAYFRSLRGQSLPVNFIKKWNISPDLLEEFLNSLWKFFIDATKILRPVILKTSNNHDLNAGQPVYQIDTSKIGIRTQWNKYHCSLCQRIHSRPTVNNVCTTMHCRGNLILKEPSKENYNIDLLNHPFAMLMAQEHTAQVPAKRREEIEREFKKRNGRFNCLVATPTLELGVDIGALDMVLMRNVPPLSSNYWQRAGRAGRRQRLAVVYTYCRRSDHDQYFFEEPLRILEGVISTPKFNMKNEIMLRKHVHATVLSELIKISIKKQEELYHSATDIQEVKEILSAAFPTFIKSYLFERDGTYLRIPKDVSLLSIIIQKNEERLVESVLRVFHDYWPEEDKSITDPDKLKGFINKMPSCLQEVVNLMHTRMLWAYNTQEKFLQYQSQRLLTQEEEKVLNRCKNFLRNLNRESQDNYTLNVLSEEGYLPGYGLYGGGIKAFAHQSYIGGGKNHPDFELSRVSTIAVREFVPGNMIYANNGRFRVVIFRITSFDENEKSRRFIVNLEKGKSYIKDLIENSSVQYSGSNLHEISATPISDCDIHYISRISDEELNRFQLPVILLGELKVSRRGGIAYSIGDKEIKLLIGQSLQLVNIGPVDLSFKGKLGYPICTVCGSTRSPYSSDAEIEHFREMHSERCGKVPSNIGLFAEAKVDGILIKQLDSQATATNLAEGILVGANLLLEMERGDLDYIVIQETDETFSLFIYDPMPGGSGLLNQIIQNWFKLIKFSLLRLAECPNKCETSCYSCLRTYYNVFNHYLLDRNYAQKILLQYLDHPIFGYNIPAEEEVRHTESGAGTNIGEKTLGKMLVEAELPKFEEQIRISIGPPYNSTVPDFYLEDTVKNIRIAIYLDGLSKEIHGNIERRKVDLIIRNILDSRGIHVIEIASSDLNDPEIMNLYFSKLANILK
ncbi:MAG TPA: helicase-related protein [Ignavibacteriaceae bacterium]|nr:helicase-related protein [Ignavibacteriaceae bacterium]